MNEKEEAIWTEADQARADLISEIACEISEDEDLVALVMDTYDRHQPTNAAAPALYEALERAAIHLNEASILLGNNVGPSTGAFFLKAHEDALAALSAAKKQD